MKAEEVIKRTKDLLQQELGVEWDKLVPDARFRDDLGADSLDMVEIIMCVESEFDIDINDEDAEKITTVGTLTEYLTKRLADG